MKKNVLFILGLILFLPAWSQRTAEEYLNRAPIDLDKEICLFTMEEFEHFMERLKSYNDSLFEDIEQRKQSAKTIEMNSSNYQKAMEILEKVTTHSTDYMAKYYCLTLLCPDFPDLLSGEEIARATVYADKVKEMIQFSLDVTTGKAQESERPGWRKESSDAQNGFCSIMGPKYIKVLENDLADLKKLMPDFRTLGSIFYTGESAVMEIEALSAVYNYLEKFRTNSFLGSMKVQFY